MLDSLPWWLWPSAAALILVLTHTYLGLHVISRNVFFVDLALAQVAALGSTVAYLYGFELADSVTYYVSLGFAVFGAWFFAFARLPEDRVPQEAIIGLSFAVASAGAILLSAENPHGAEHLRDMMSGSILVVSGTEVRQAALLYAAIGVFHWLFRRQFLLISTDREAALASGMRVRLWDFLFYLSFALVITSSVRIAGVLLVFILLIAPAVCGAMLAVGIRNRLLVGWGSGVVATIFGLALSARQDWPPAPAISCIFAAVLLLAALGSSLLRSTARTRLFAQFAAAGAVLFGLGYGLTTFLGSSAAASLKEQGTAEEPHSHGEPEHPHGTSRADLLLALSDEHEQVRAAAAEQLGKLNDTTVVGNLMRALEDPAAAVKEKAAQALGGLGLPEAVPALEAALARHDDDEWVNLHQAEALVLCGGKNGMAALLDIAANADAKLVRADALRLALAFAGRTPTANDKAAEAALKELLGWWKKNQHKARWDAESKRFVL